MSIVSSFVLESARNGRWVRGILALQGSLQSEDVDVAKARIQLGSTIFDKNWVAALALVKPNDISHVDILCRFLYECSKSPNVPSQVFGNITSTFLNITKGNSETQNSIFLSTIKWTTWQQAIEFFTLVDSPRNKSKRELSEWLNFSRMFGSEEKKRIIDSYLKFLSISNFNHKNTNKWNQLNLKENISNNQIFINKEFFLSKALESLKQTDSLDMISVVNLAKAVIREEDISWKLPLSLISKNRVIEDSNEIFAKMIGICCPQLWQVALNKFNLDGKIALWLASRHSWKAGLIVSQSILLSNYEKYDILSQCVFPNYVLQKFITILKASKKLSQPNKKSIASELASGYVLEELQLSAFSKLCQKNGDWESAIYLFNRISNEEFQKRAIKCLLEHYHSIKMEQLLKLISDRRPATTSTASLLIKNSNDWTEALYVLRYVMSRGTKCNPQILSAVMDVKPPINILLNLIGKLKYAANKGILSRLSSLENKTSTK